jgi:hypothetical protein
VALKKSEYSVQILEYLSHTNCAYTREYLDSISKEG